MAKPHHGAWLRVRALIVKECRQILRDPSNIAVGILLPIALILIFGYGMSLDVSDIRVGVWDQENSQQTRDITQKIAGSPEFKPVRVWSQQEGVQRMRDHAIEALVVFPADFSRQNAQGLGQIQVLNSGTDAARSMVVRNMLEGVLNQWMLTQADRSGQKLSSLTIQTRTWFNSANTSTWYLVPGLIVIILTLIGAFLTSMVMAREWERGTLEALFATPVRPWEILLAKMVPCFLIGVLGLALCLMAASWLFRVPIQGSLGLIVLSSLLYLLVALGIGLVISSATKNQFLASQMALLASFLPATMLSGFLFDLRNVPQVVNYIAHALPATYFMDLIKTLFLAGNIWPLVWLDGAMLALFALVLFVLSIKSTPKKIGAQT